MRKLLRVFSDQFLSILTPLALIFIVLYPKLPSVSITHTWVYIRLEDFVISFLAIIWLINLLRRKINLPIPIGYSIILYWLIGLLSLIFSLIFIAPHLANFFPKIAWFNYIRRIEYMGLFFISFATVKKPEDVKKYIIALWIMLTGVIIYGFGQRWYLVFWHLFPKFFEKYPFCFPSFQTGNEEFAKGIPLCLPSDARITSTFAGHYDLAAFLVVIIPIALIAAFNTKNRFKQLLAFLLTSVSVILLILTASRISFVAYLIAVCCALIFTHRKKFIIPVVLVSIGFLILLSGSTAKRFMETFRITSVVTTSQGQVIGIAQNSLPKDLQNKISKNPVVVEAPPPTQNLPAGSGFITLPQAAPKTTNVAVVKSSVGQDVVKKLKLANGGFELSTVSGSFLIQKALVYDISFTTRFQGEWPAAWAAFMRNPILGSGYSSITLATDGDYYRMLGETGILGFVSFAVIFMCLGILIFLGHKKITDASDNGFVFALAGGCIGLFFNATFIDVFEASKVAEPLWILLGVGVGVVLSVYKEKVPYFSYLWKIFTSKILISTYLYVLLAIIFFGTISLYFVADDFTWLRWAASSNISDVVKYFFNAGSFFYRPLDKAIMLGLYTFFSFLTPQGYHIFMLTVHFVTTFGVFLLLQKLIKNKLWAFLGSVLFLVLPIHAEDLYWISTISTNIATLFTVYGVMFWLDYREKSQSIFWYILSILCFAGGLMSYEMSVILPFLLVLTDLYKGVAIKNKQRIIEYAILLLILLGYGFLRMHAGAVGPNGDYSVRLEHVIPNVFGNSIGYAGAFIAGESFLPIYTFFRSETRNYAVILSVVIILVAIGLAAFLRKRKNIFIVRQNPAVYGFLFGIISLLPFLGLGNLAPRYLYLASVGWIISVVFLFWYISKKGVVLRIASISIFVVFIIAGSIAVKNASYQWQKAGEITNRTLQILHQDYSKLEPGYRLIFINVPIRFDNAWVFPVGLQDGIWFIYRDDTMKVYEVKNFDQARELIRNDKFHVTRFYFDSYGNLSQVD